MYRTQAGRRDVASTEGRCTIEERTTHDLELVPTTHQGNTDNRHSNHGSTIGQVPSSIGLVKMENLELV